MPQWFERSMDTVHDENFVKGFFEEYRYLSNFHLCEVHYEGRVYPSSENAYQAAKAELDSEKDKFTTVTPSQSKKMGKTVLMRSDWEKVKVKIMEEIVRDKFTRNSDIRNLLLQTGNRYLEETNWWGDKFWGVCKGVGRNELGKILMKVRNELNDKVGQICEHCKQGVFKETGQLDDLLGVLHCENCGKEIKRYVK